MDISASGHSEGITPTKRPCLDNIVLTEYEQKGDKEEAKVVLKEDFEKPQSALKAEKSYLWGGNRKLGIWFPVPAIIGYCRLICAEQIPMFRKEIQGKKKIASARIYSSALRRL